LEVGSKPHVQASSTNRLFGQYIFGLLVNNPAKPATFSTI